MSELVPSVLVLDKGLNLQTAKFIAPPGSVFDTLNYEQVDFQGHKRIDGYARYDGLQLPTLDEYYIVPAAQASITDNLIIEDGRVLAVVLAEQGDDLHVALVDENYLLPTPGKESGLTPDEHYELLLEYTQVLRNRVGTLPGAIIGLHWFRDRLYAVADVAAVLLTGAVGISPNDTTVEGERVIDVITVGGDTMVFIDATTNSYTAGQTFSVTTGASGTVSSTIPSIAADKDIASFFQARTEQQALDDSKTAGWSFIHQGWRVMFANGFALFGGLAALNQNRQGVGTQGPTSTGGNNGRPLVLVQAPPIANIPPQVSGWKSSDDPTSYALNPATVKEIDDDYTYADAYISWDGETGVVSAPGADMIGLIQYSATASVVVDV